MDVYVAQYVSGGQETVRAFASYQLAMDWKDIIANANWHEKLGELEITPGSPTDKGTVGGNYFMVCSNTGVEEFFFLDECEVEVR